MSSNFFEALHQIATDKGIPREDIEMIVESAMLSAFKKQYGMVSNAKVVFDRDKNTVSVVSKRLVVNKPINLAEEIAYSIYFFTASAICRNANGGKRPSFLATSILTTYANSVARTMGRSPGTLPSRRIFSACCAARRPTS